MNENLRLILINLCGWVKNDDLSMNWMKLWGVLKLPIFFWIFRLFFFPLTIKSSWLISVAFRRSAIMPASTQTAYWKRKGKGEEIRAKTWGGNLRNKKLFLFFIYLFFCCFFLLVFFFPTLSCAPLKSSVQRANSSKFTSAMTKRERKKIKQKKLDLQTLYFFYRFVFVCFFTVFFSPPLFISSSLPLLTFILRLWICRMRARASSFGSGNSIFRSSRPERSSAGSKMSIRFVAATTFTPDKRRRMHSNRKMRKAKDEKKWGE